MFNKSPALLHRQPSVPDSSEIFILTPDDLGSSNTRTNRYGYSGSPAYGKNSKLDPNKIVSLSETDPIWWFYCGQMIEEQYYFFAIEYWDSGDWVECFDEQEYTTYFAIPAIDLYIHQSGAYNKLNENTGIISTYLLFNSDDGTNICKVDKSVNDYLRENIGKQVVCYLSCRPTQQGYPDWFKL